MALRKAHGAAAAGGALLVIEHAPPDELPAGTPAAPSSPVERRSDGTVTPEGARALGRQGGIGAAERRRYASQLADTLGMGEVGPGLVLYVDAAREFAEVHLHDLAQSVGGGRVGPGVASMVQSAALALAASRAMYAEGSRTGDHRLLGQAAQLADKSRTSLLTAHELAAREAAARPPKPEDFPWFHQPAKEPSK
jgi:hypothetical protein